MGDSVGRRPIFKAKNAMSLLPTMALALHVFCGMTLWIYLVIGPIYEMFDINGVFLALLTDIVKSPEERSKAFATFIVMVVGIAVVVIPFAGLMPMNVAVGVSLLAAVAKVAFVFTCFPETAPLVKKVEEQRSGLLSVGGQAFAIIRRNGFISRMVFVLIVSGFGSAGSHTIGSSYFTAYMSMERSEITALVFVAGLSLAITLAGIMGPLTRKLGDIQTMQFSLAISAVTPLGIIASSEKWQLFVLFFFLTGPGFLQVPLISAIKSNLVGEHEQGLVQGVLAAVRVIAVAVADAFFGWFYREATDHGRSSSRTSAFGPYLLVATLGLFALGIACTLPLDVYERSVEEHKNGQQKREEAAARELELVSLKENAAIGNREYEGA